MDLKSYLAILRGNIWVILVTFVVTVVVATLLTFLITPIYAATTTLRVATASSGVVSAYSDYMYADRLMNTYTKLATSSPVMDELRTRLNIQHRPDITVAIIPNTELIKITVESSDPNLAQNSANTLADIMISLGKELYTGGGKSTMEILAEQITTTEAELGQARQALDAFIAQNPSATEQIDALKSNIQYKEQAYATLLEQYDQARLREVIRANIISVVEPAVFPSSPTKPNKMLNIGLGILVGLVGGVGLAFLFENFGTRLVYLQADRGRNRVESDR